MANEIIIDVTVDMKENELDKVDELNQKLKDLDNYKNINLEASFENSKALSSLKNIEDACDRMESRLSRIMNSRIGVIFNVDIVQGEQNINRIVQRLSGVSNKSMTISVNTRGLEKTTPSSLQRLVNNYGVSPSGVSRIPITNTSSSAYAFSRENAKNQTLFSKEDDSGREAANDIVTSVVSTVGAVIGGAIGTVAGPAGIAGGAITGEALGTAIGSITGTVFGTLLGDIPGNIIFGEKKTPEERYQDFVAQNFGTASLTPDSLSNTIDNMLQKHGVSANPNRYGINSEKSMQENQNISYEDLHQQEYKIGLKQKNGIGVSDDEYATYLNSAQGFAEGAVNAFTQQWANEHKGAEGNSELTAGIDQMYAELLNGNSEKGLEGINNIKKDMNDYVQRAISDNNFTPDEMDEVGKYIQKVQDYTKNNLPDMTKLNVDSSAFLLGSDKLSRETYLDMISGLKEKAKGQREGYAEDRQNVLNSGARAFGLKSNKYDDVVQNADRDYYEKSGNSLAGTFKSGLEIFQNQTGSQFTDAQNMYLGKTKTQKQNLVKQDQYKQDYLEVTEIGEWKNGKYLQEKLGFKNLSPEYKTMAGDFYSQFTNELTTMEQTAKNTLNSNGDVSGMLGPMKEMYEVGAAGGDPIATEKYWATVVAQDEKMSKLMDDILADPKRSKGLSDNFKGTYGLYHGQAIEKEPDMQVSQTADAGQNTITGAPFDTLHSNGFPQQTAGGVTTESTAEQGNMVSDQFASNALKSIEQSFTGGNIDFKSLGIGTSLMKVIGESLSASEIDFSQLDLGQKLIGKIGESLTKSEIDFGQLDFGKNLMSAVVEGLTESKIDFKGLGLGESLIGKIGEGLTATQIDFSGLGFGENLMTALIAGLTESKIDFKGLGLGESLIGKIGEGLTATQIDFSGLSFGENLMTALVTGLTESKIDFKGLGLGESLIGKIGEGLTATEIDFSGLGFGENLMTALVTGLTESEINFEDLGLGESLLGLIGESLTDTEIDFSELGFGETLMSALVTALTESEIDFEGLGLGESLLGLIGESLTDTEIDFSELGLGETLMSALMAGLTESEIDFEGLGLGESLMGMIGESLSAIDFSESGIGESLMGSIAAALSSVSFEEMDLGGLGEGISASIASSLGELDLSGIAEQFSVLNENPIQLEAIDNATPILQNVQSLAESLAAINPSPTISATDNASGIIASVSSALSDLNGRSATVEVRSIKTGDGPLAAGTLGAEGGLALINDEATADPRELIERDGQYMMYQGRNVLTVLEPNDRVYTASQTKTLMANMGIPYYEKGKNNAIINGGGGTIATGTGSSGSSGIAVGGVNLSINVSGGDADVIDQIKKRGEEVAEYIAGTISHRLSDAYANAPVTAE